ncbi:MAG TPA: sulfurtransferase [Microbacteriaceae bacterium]|nr:sulfurtransferase [Microbacteriaceae bacterium]
MPDRSDFLVTASALAAELAGDAAPIVLDIRWRSDHPDGREAFEAGHIPGAVYVGLDDVFSEHGHPTDGRHPLPSRERLVEALSGVTASRDSPIVTLDDSLSWAACRAWWVLRDAGFRSVRVLDGGLASWNAAGLPIETGSVPVMARRPLELGETGILPQLSIDEAAALPHYGLLFDARAPERYRGEIEPLDPRAGHIPGALNLPVSTVFRGDGTFKDADELSRLFADYGVRQSTRVGVYCGSGVSATPLVFAMHLAGIEAALYAGSWSQWSNSELRPIAVGASADGDVQD